MWINSLGLEDLYVNSLFEECKEGMLLLQVMDHVSPGCVDWTKVEKKAGKNQIKRTMNCSTAVNSAIKYQANLKFREEIAGCINE